ncbi:MAG TPA: RyR domain-containing protein [Caulobacteraceae bacterium]
MKDGFFPFRLAWLIPVAALVTIGLGLWGWLAVGKPADEALYRAIALFDINNSAYADGPGIADWRFRVGRWTGAFVVFSSLVALAALLREHIATALARWTKQQVMIAGGEPLAMAAFDVARTRKSVLWLGASAFTSIRFSAIALPWPPRDHARAVSDYARRADHLLIAEKDDAAALALARAARAAAPNAELTVIMSDVRLAEDAAATLNDPRARVVAAGQVAARALNLAHPPFLIARERGQARIHALIVGFGQTGQAIARDLIVNCRTTYLAPPRLTVIDPMAEALEGVLRVRAPELDACAEHRFVEGEIGGRAVRPEPAAIAAALADGGPLTAAYVCLADDTAALSAATMLQSLLRSLDMAAPAIFVRLRSAGAIGEAGRPDAGGLDALTPFGDLEAVLAASDFLADAPDAAARAFHAAYRASLPAQRRDDPAHASARPWEDLAETYRRTNRDAVAHIPAKLASAGVDPADWRGRGGPPRLAACDALSGDPAGLEALAVLEHERWSAQRRMDGWRAAPAGGRDEAARRNPDLKPWAELSEESKRYDRVIVKCSEAACRGDGK